MRLPASIQEIADVIGRDRALHLVSQLPRSPRPARGWAEERVIAYVPTPARLKPDHGLVKILGWNDALKLSRHFGGEILHLAKCAAIQREERNTAIAALVIQRTPNKAIAAQFGLTERYVRSIAATVEIPPEASRRPANDNSPASANDNSQTEIKFA